MKMTKQEEFSRGLVISQKVDSDTSKVLPISGAPVTSSATTNINDKCTDPSGQKKEKIKDNKTKTLSRMKELIRWAAAAKYEKGGKFMGRKVLPFRNRGDLKLKHVPHDDPLFNESPKISFRWDTESCSTISSLYSGISTPSLRKNDVKTAVSVSSAPIHGTNQCTTKRGNWITTDSEFVVLEL